MLLQTQFFIQKKENKVMDIWIVEKMNDYRMSLLSY